MNLQTLGWNGHFAEAFSQINNSRLFPARVMEKHRGMLKIEGEVGTFSAKLTGKLLREAEDSDVLPSVGDWVAAEKVADAVLVHGVLPRQSAFSRKPAISGGRKLKNGIIIGGSTREQVLAANIDIVFIVTGLDHDFNLQRIERYITLAWHSGAQPVLLLNKADLCPDAGKRKAQVEQIALGQVVIPLSMVTGLGLKELEACLASGTTVAFLGSSGVGKSTIINKLFGEELQRTNAASTATGKGRHTTTSAKLLKHPLGYMIVDTPGIRELQLWCEEDSLAESFADVAALARACKFSDCSHGREPGCAVREAMEAGDLSPARFHNFCKLQEEIRRLEVRKQQSSAQKARKGLSGRQRSIIQGRLGRKI